MSISALTTVAAFYRFMPLVDLARLRESLKAVCAEPGVTGILLVAPEGLNGTLAGPKDALLAALRGIEGIVGGTPLEPKFSEAAAPPFKRLKIRIKKEIVTLGAPEADPNVRVGTYVEPKDWNALISDPEVLLIDARNTYEVALGAFGGAVDPGTRSFGEFPAVVQEQFDPRRHRKIAMYCTGGIRCEKASSYMLAHGFEEVYHLKGGILSYLETVPEADSLWRGGCFVFDERVAVGHGLKPLDIRLCIACDAPLDDAARASPLFEDGVSCPACHGSRSEASKAALRERQRQISQAAGSGQHNPAREER